MIFLSARGPTRRREVTGQWPDAGEELARRYAEHSRPLLRLAALLVPEITTANEVMYEAFAAMHRAGNRIGGPDDAFAFLLRDVVFRARAARKARGEQVLPLPGGQFPRGQEITVLDAVRALPGRQREALVLRYYGQLSDAEAAAAMGIDSAQLRAHVVRGMATLRAYL